MRLDQLTLQDHGAQLFKAALSAAQLDGLQSALSGQPHGFAGIRLYDLPQLSPFLQADGPVGRIPASVLGPACFPVRAIFFDKSPEQNWGLTWHQDRTIAVRRRIEVEGFGRGASKAA